jgi:hypothetical protein
MQSKKINQIPDFLIEMSNQMRSQPTRCTAHPLWQVRCNRLLPTEEGHNQKLWEIFHDEGVAFTEGGDPADFFDYLIEYHPDFCKNWAEYESPAYEPGGDVRLALESDYRIGEDELPKELRLIHMQEVEEVVSTHFTEAEALAFIKRKQHDYPKLYTYVESAYWSPQIRALQDWIISLTDDSPPQTQPTE